MSPPCRIDTLQENLKGTQQQLALVGAQLEAQRRETRAALETLAEAEVGAGWGTVLLQQHGSCGDAGGGGGGAHGMANGALNCWGGARVAERLRGSGVKVSARLGSEKVRWRSRCTGLHDGMQPHTPAACGHAVVAWGWLWLWWCCCGHAGGCGDGPLPGGAAHCAGGKATRLAAAAVAAAAGVGEGAAVQLTQAEMVPEERRRLGEGSAHVGNTGPHADNGGGASD